MLRHFPSVALLILLACLPARAEDLAAARSAIEAQYARLDAAIDAKNASPYDSIAAPDLKGAYATGNTFDLAGATKAWQEAVKMIQTVKSRTVVESAVADGAAVRVVVHMVQEGTLTMNGEVTPFRAESTALDTWARIGAEWRLSLTSEVVNKTWLNGSLVQVATAPLPLSPVQRDAIIAELHTRLIPFKTVTAGSGFDDLAVLDAIVGDARIVALGESTHGTAEFFRMKHRIFEYLVERKGFTVFAFETNWVEAEIVNRYVQTGVGAAASAIRSIFSVWQTQEVLDLIEWMRAYNARPGRTKLLSFAAFDMQGPEAAARCVIEAVSRLGSADGEVARGIYAGIDDRMYGRMDAMFSENPLSEEEKADFRAKATAGRELMEERREALAKALTPAELRRADRCATTVVQASAVNAKASVELGDARDQAMAENIKWLAEEVYPGERIAVWAHNAHVAAGPDARGTQAMGVHLRKSFGEQLRVLGFAFDRGLVTASELKQGKPSQSKLAMAVPPSRPDTLEALLRAAGVPRAILDLRTLPTSGALGEWLGGSQPIRSIGWGFDPEHAAVSYQSYVLQQAFDALIFLEETTATTLLK